MVRLPVCLAAILALLPAVGLAATPVARPAGIVWIVADDMSLDVAAYGAAGVATPNLDRLAREGRRFTRAYASAPVCSSSRSAFILGCYQTTTGLHPHDVENPQPLAAPFMPLPTLLREAGWFVTNTAAPGTVRGGREIRRGKTHYNFVHDSATFFDGDDWRQRRPGQPFFAQYQILEPHRAFPIPESFDEAALAVLPLPANYPDHPLVRRDWYAYLRSVEVVDRRVGDILAMLEAEGVLDDTIVVFFADHGRPMPWGKQWLTVEGLHVPLIVRGPGIAAGSVEEGVVSLIDLAPSAVASAGLPMPAWVEGLPVVHGGAGGVPADRAVFAARDRCGDAMDRSRAVITADALLVRNDFTDLPRLSWSSYKESAYPGMPLLRTLEARGALTPLEAAWLAPTRPAVELYDLAHDPAGLHNVAATPAEAARRAALEARLDDWLTTSGDTGAAGDPPTEPPLAEIQAQKRAGYARVWKNRLGLEDPSDSMKLAWWLAAYALAEDTDADEHADAFRPLFNGTDLTSWDGNPKFWTVEDGCITGRTTDSDRLRYNQFLIWRGGTPRNFELRATIRQQGNNSGIQYRSRELPEVGRWSVGGYQCDVHPAAANNAMVYDEKGRGIVVQNGQSVVVDPDGVRWVVAEWDPVEVDVNDWHEYAIVARGNRLVHMIDGRTTIELVDHEEAKRSLEGLIGFQVHRGPPMEVQIKDVMLKELPDGDVVAFDPAAIPAAARRLERPQPRPRQPAAAAPAP
jgi:N-sulfoglucosamine sulfohydrolase